MVKIKLCNATDLYKMLWCVFIMDKLKQLISKCKCGIHLTVNQHRDYYETVEQHFKDEEEWLEEIDPLVYEKMKEGNTIVELQVYPHTPIGFFRIYHYDVECAVDAALKELNAP